MAGKPTLYDVAQAAGVSIATVSFAFTKPSRVRPATLERVLSSASALGYVPSANARGLASGRTGALGLYAFDYLIDSVPGSVDGQDPLARIVRGDDGLGDARTFPLYSDEVQRGVALECRARGYALMIGAGKNPGHLPNVIDVAGRVDALITFARAVSSADLEQVRARIPVVELGGEHRADGVPTVAIDNHGAMAELVRHLLEVHGYRTFAYLGAAALPETADRYQGFADTLRAAGLPVPPVAPSSPGEDQRTARVLRSMLDGAAPPEVIVCSTDQEALVALDVLRSAGLAVPADVAVVGFDGILAGRLSTPQITTMRQPMEEIGRSAVRQLAVRLGDEAAGDEGTEPELLRCSLVVRSSCGC